MDNLNGYAINYKNIKVKCSDGSLIAGKINIVPHARLSDHLKLSAEKFISIISEDKGAEPGSVHMVSMDHIVWVNTWD